MVQRDSIAATALRAAVVSAIVLSVATFALGALARLSGWEVWDDGLMFARYAENVVRHGAVAWNPGSEPTWGLTSLGHLAWLLVVRSVTSVLGADALGATVLSSWLAGLAFLAASCVVAWRHSRGLSPAMNVIWTCVCLALGFRSWGGHLGTGMDTMTTLVWLLLFVVLADGLWRRATTAGRARGLALATGLVAGSTFFVRPDVTLFPAAVLAALVALLALGDRPGKREAAVGALLASLVWGGLLWLAARAYFGTPMPLPYYVKGGGGAHYGAAFAAEYAGLASAELLLFAAAFWLPLLAVLLDAASDPRAWWRQTSPVDKGLAAAAVAFAGYHLTQVAPIMGGSQRFFQPLVPVLLWLSWGAVGRLAPRLARGIAAVWSRRWGRVARQILAGSLLVLPLAPLGVSAYAEARRCAETLHRPDWPHLDLEAIWSRRAGHYWPALDVVSELPPETMLAATEVGLPGAMNPDKIVVDLAGLHDPRFALRGFSADEVFAPRPPDVIYLPHRHYEEMTRQLTGHAVFSADYRVWTADELGSVLGVALRRGSVAEAPLADALERRVERRAGSSTGARSRR